MQFVPWVVFTHPESCCCFVLVFHNCNNFEVVIFTYFFFFFTVEAFTSILALNSAPFDRSLTADQEAEVVELIS